MAIKLRDGEKIQSEAQLHWANYIIPGIWAFMFSITALGALVGPERNARASFYFILFGWLPVGYVFLKNYCKSYVITNQRLYVEEGILAKSKRDIPLDKINDFEAKQGLLQRFFGAGDVLALTGNNKPTRLTNISSVEVFREAASKLISEKRAG